MKTRIVTILRMCEKIFFGVPPSPTIAAKAVTVYVPFSLGA